MKKIVALLMAVIMVIGMLPTMAFAEDGEEVVSEEVETEEVAEPEEPEEETEEVTEPEEEAEPEEEITETVPARYAGGITVNAYNGVGYHGKTQASMYVTISGLTKNAENTLTVSYPSGLTLTGDSGNMFTVVEGEPEDGMKTATLTATPTSTSFNGRLYFTVSEEAAYGTFDVTFGGDNVTQSTNATYKAGKFSVGMKGSELLATADEDGVITLSDDTILATTMKIPKDTTYAMDLNGHTLTYMIQKNDITDEDGFNTITLSNLIYIGIYNAGTLDYIMNGTIEIVSQNAMAIANGGTINTVGSTNSMKKLTIKSEHNRLLDDDYYDPGMAADGEMIPTDSCILANLGTIGKISYVDTSYYGISGGDYAFYTNKNTQIESIENCHFRAYGQSLKVFNNNGTIGEIKSTEILASTGSETDASSYGTITANAALINQANGVIKKIDNSKIESRFGEAGNYSYSKNTPVALKNLGKIELITNSKIYGDKNPTKSIASALITNGPIDNIEGAYFYGEVSGSQSRAIDGGYYTKNLAFDFCKKDYVCKELQTAVEMDGKSFGYQVVKDKAAWQAIADTYSVASITSGGVTTKYISLNEAIDAVEPGETIQLIDNIEISTATFEGKKDVTLDLNGHTITSETSDTAANMLILVKNSNIVVKDSGTSGGITETNTGKTLFYVVTTDQQKPCTLTVESGTYDSKGWIFKEQEANCTINIKGGTFTNSGSYAIISGWNNPNTQVNITGGSFTSTGTWHLVDDIVTTLITGGTFKIPCSSFHPEKLVPGYNNETYSSNVCTVGETTVSRTSTNYSNCVYTVTSPAHKLHYEMNGYGTQIEDSDVQCLPSIPNIPSSPAKKFAGWWKSSDFTGWATPGEIITEDTTLYAKWVNKEDCEAEIGEGNEFPTLALAIEYAKAGDTVTLLKDITVGEDISTDKSITLDTNGKTVTVVSGKNITGNLNVTAGTFVDFDPTNICKFGYFGEAGTGEQANTYVVTQAAAILTSTVSSESKTEYKTEFSADTVTAFAAEEGSNKVITLTKNSKSGFTLPVGVTFIVPGTIAYSGTVSAPEGYFVKTTFEADGTHYSLRVENQQTNVPMTEDKVTINEDEKTVPAITVNDTAMGDGGATEEQKKVAVEVLEDINSNTNVTNFSDVNINPALKSDSSAKDEEQKLDVVLKGIKVETEASTSYSETSIKSVYSETFDVKPMVQVEEEETGVTVTDEQGKIWKTIPNEEIEGEITFRLPVKKEITKEVAAVYHQANAGADKTLLGFYPIEGNETNGKYIELSASEFSIYTYEVMSGVSTTDTLVIKHSDDSFTGYKQLITTDEGEENEVEGAVSKWVDGDKELILMQDYTIGATENFQGKTITLELNGHKLSSNVTDGQITATGVTVQNRDTENQDTLAAPGVYANDVSAFAADGYDTKKTTIDGDTLFKKDLGMYTVVVTTAPGAGTADRDPTNDDPTKNLDVFAGDKVTVTVKVEGATFAAADVTLTFDSENFKVTAPRTWSKVDNNNYRFYNYKTGGKYYENGEILGTFTFTVKEGDSEKLNEMFKVSVADAYIAPQWASGWDSSPANALNAGQLKDDFVNIRLKQMTATVTPNTGLVYKEVGQKLLADSYTAKDTLSGAAITDATIKYAVLTKEQVNGVLFTGAEGQTESGTVPGYVDGKEPKTPATTDYTEAQPMMTNADDYVIFWQVSRLGYITATGQESVSIAPLDVTLTWVMPGDKKAAISQTGTPGGDDYVAGYTPKVIKATESGDKDGLQQEITADFWSTYSPEGFYFESENINLNAGSSAPAAGGTNMYAYVKALNIGRTAKITMTGKPDTAGANVMKVVGTYEFTADLGSNYNISNPTVTVLIDGGVIQGFTLTASDSVFFDGASHVSATKTDGEEADQVKKEFRYSADGGETWSEWKENEIPSLIDANAVPYKIQMRLSRDSFYTVEKEVEFSIQPVQYYVEKNDYVTGWDLVLVYTDEEVPSFNYNGKQMFDVSAFGYKLGTVFTGDKEEVTTEGTGYKYVYGIVVEGNADTNKVLPSNTKLYTGENKGDNVDHKITLSGKGRLDVNKSVSDEKPQGSIDINDLVAVAAVYNVDRSYLTSTEESVIAIVLRADVSGNKTVDTYDCSLVKTNTGK